MGETAVKRYASKEQINEAKALLKATNWEPKRIAETTGVGLTTVHRYSLDIRGPKKESRKGKMYVGEASIEVAAAVEQEEVKSEQLSLSFDEEVNGVGHGFSFTTGHENTSMLNMMNGITDLMDTLNALGIKEVSYKLVVENPSK